MRVLAGLGCVALAIVVATVSISRGDDESTEPPASDEPITGTPVQGSGSAEPVEVLSYDIGPPEAAWSYEQLSGAEKAVADRGLDEDQTAVQSGYAAATAALAAQATADRAALQLGVDEALEETGVVP